MKYVRRIAALLLGTTFAASVGQAGAQPGGTYPSKPIRIIVSIAAGSLTDVVARTAGQHVRSSFGQQVVIDNRPGGNMTIGAEACARAAPDGYTFCLVSNTAMSINPHIYSKLPYDPDTGTLSRSPCCSILFRDCPRARRCL